MIKKHNYGVIHQIAICSDCEWRNENYRHSGASRAGKKHCEKKGHAVVIETGTSYRYEPTTQSIKGLEHGGKE